MVDYCDIVIPDVTKGNESKFIEIAEKLRFQSICFLFDLKNYKQSKDLETKFNTKLNIFTGILCNQKDINKAKNKSNLTVMKTDGYPRDIIEQYKPNIVYGMEYERKRDYMHQRNANTNHSLINIANKMKTQFGISFADLINCNNKSQIMGRIMQNFRLYQKYNSTPICASFTTDPYLMRSPKDLIYLLVELGLDRNIAKESMKILPQIIKNNELRKKGLKGNGFEVVE